MIRLGWLQFKHSWRVWLLTSGSFTLAGWLLGTCLTGIVSLQSSLPVLVAAGHDPTPLFVAPLVLGGITLFLVLTGIIRAVLNEFKMEYQLWALQGANSRQLAELVSVQIGMMALIGSAVGWVLAISTVEPTYSWMQSWIGSTWLPSVPFKITMSVAFLTIGGVTLLSSLSGFINTKRLLRQQSKVWRGWRIVTSGLRSLLLVLGVLGLGRTFIQIRSTQGNGLFTAMAWIIMILLVAGQFVSVGLLRLLGNVLQLYRHERLNIAYQQLRSRSGQLASIVVPLLITQTITIGILLMIYGFSVGSVDVQNVMVSLVVYVGAPVLVVVVNCGAVILLESHHQAANLKQLTICGLTPSDLVRERLGESVLYALVFLCGALLIDGVLYSLVALSDVSRLINIMRITVLIPLSVAGGMGLFVSLVSDWQVYQWQAKQVG